MSLTLEIHSVLETLHRIQTELNDLNGRLRRGPLVLKSQEAAIEKATAKCDAVLEKHKQLQVDVKMREQAALASDQAITKRKQQLVEAKNNKDYQALQQQIKADEVARSVLDDEILEAMDKVEQHGKLIPNEEAEVKKAQELYDRTKRKFVEDKPGIEQEIVRCQGLLAEEEKKLSREFREIYDRLVRQVGGANSLACVVNQKFCEGCNYQVPVNSLAMLTQGKPITCSSCARLLFLPEDFVFDKG